MHYQARLCRAVRGAIRRGAEGLAAELRGGLVRQIVPDDMVTGAPREARAAGWVPFVSRGRQIGCRRPPSPPRLTLSSQSFSSRHYLAQAGR